MYDDLAGLAIVLLALVLPTALLWAWGGPIESKAVQDNLIRAGLVNAVGEAPMLEAKWISPDNPKITVYEFFCRGVPLEAAHNQDRFGIEHYDGGHAAGTR